MRSINFILGGLFLCIGLLVWSGCASKPKPVQPSIDYPASAPAAEKYQAAEQAIANKDYNSALVLLKAASKLTKNAKQSEQILFQTGECQFYLGQYKPANSTYSKLLERFPTTDRLNDVIKREFDIGLKLTAAHYGLGVEIVRKMLTDYPYAETSEESHFKLIVELFQWDNYEDTLLESSAFTMRYTKSKFMPGVEYYTALAQLGLYEGPDYDEAPLAAAKKIVSQWPQKYPDSPIKNDIINITEKINFLLAERDYKRAEYYVWHDKPGSAKIYLNSIIKNYPDTKWVEDARKLLGKLPAQ